MPYQPGDEVICDKTSHVYIYEGGGIAFNSRQPGKSADGERGRVIAEQVAEAINSDDIHKPRTSLVSLENTVNRGGGSCYELLNLKGLRKFVYKIN
ncbi:MAG: beta-eliminating lyase-related protein [Ferruginibacter sp.]